MNGIKVRKKAEKQICLHAFTVTFSRKHGIWSFHVVVLQRTENEMYRCRNL